MEIKERIKLNKVTHSVRASQAVLQYGVGAMVDFPEQTLMTAAPETWNTSVMEIHDERLEKVLKIEYIGMPGSNDEAKYQNGISYAREVLSHLSFGWQAGLLHIQRPVYFNFISNT